MSVAVTEGKRPKRLAINRLLDRRPLDEAMITRFIDRYGAPIVEGARTTFLWRGEADEVMVRHRVVGLPTHSGCAGSRTPTSGTPRPSMPEGSRVEYQFEVGAGRAPESYVNDPLNPKLAHGPFGGEPVCATTGYVVPDWTLPDPEARPGEIVGALRSRARLCAATGLVLRLPTRADPPRHPLPAARGARRQRLSRLRRREDGARQPDPPPRGRGDGSWRSSHPATGCVEYANHAPHARFVARELVPHLPRRIRWSTRRTGAA